MSLRINTRVFGTLYSWNQRVVNSKWDTWECLMFSVRLCFRCNSQLCTGGVRAVIADTDSASGLMEAWSCNMLSGHRRASWLVVLAVFVEGGPYPLGVVTGLKHVLHCSNSSLPICVQKKYRTCFLHGRQDWGSLSSAFVWLLNPLKFLGDHT